jgi:cyclase
MRAMLRSGADKVAINSAAVRTPRLMADGAWEFGAQAIVVAIDARRRKGQYAVSSEQSTFMAAQSPDWLATREDLQVSDESGWEVYVRGGRVPTGIDAVAWAREVERRGAGEIMLTSMDGDGTKAGYDVALTRAVADAVTIPVIASGGAGTRQHFADALIEGKADAALAASLFHFQELAISDVKRFLAEKNVAVRI